MSKSAIAKLFPNGRSQAVRLPQEFRFEGTEVRIRRVPGGVLLSPVLSTEAWFAELDRLGGRDFPERAEQPEAPPAPVFE